MTLQLDTSVQFLKGVGPRRAEAFARMGVRTIEDLLYHTPHRYLDATTVTPIARVVVGQDVTVVGRVVSKGVLPTRKRLRVFRAILKDATGIVECAWPGQAFLDRTIEPGQLLLVTGPVKYFHGRQIVPREQIILEEAMGATGTAGAGEESDIAAGLVIPIYPATEGLSHRLIRRILGQRRRSRGRRGRPGRLSAVRPTEGRSSSEAHPPDGAPSAQPREARRQERLSAW